VLTRHRHGRRGETLAAKHLTARGYTLEARNWSCATGELDLVCRDGDTLVFVEVRTVSTGFLTSPLQTIDAAKQARVARAAEAYVRKKRSEYANLRFDVVGVVLKRPPQIEHLENAFTAPWAY
jgi:putative endonuclease